MHIETLTTDDAYRRLRTRPEGLSNEEAAIRLREHGINDVDHTGPPSIWTALAGEFTHFFALLLLAAAALSLFAARQSPGEGMGTLAVAIVLVVVINGLFSFWQQFKAEQTLAELRRLLPSRVSVVRAHQTREIQAQQLVPGDVVLLDEGARIPADCRLVDVHDLVVNNATVTGESFPLSRTSHPGPRLGLLEAENLVLAGTVVLSGHARGLVFATGSETVLGQIAKQTGSTAETPSPLTLEIHRISRFVTAIALSLGAVFFLASQALGMAPWQGALISIGLIVGLVPEGLLPTVTLSLALGSQRLGKKNALVRHLAAIEALGAVTVVCTDKTGTLTKNKMAAHMIRIADEEWTLHDDPELLPRLGARWPWFFQTARWCENLRHTQIGHHHELLGDPMEIALVEMAQKALPHQASPPNTITRQDEIPFDSTRKRLSVLYALPDGYVVYTKGAMETVLPLCTEEWHSDAARPLTPQRKEALLQEQERLAARGLRVLGLAGRRMNSTRSPDRWEEEMIFLGIVGLQDPPRPEVHQSIDTCRHAGIRVIMMTGDHPTTALAIADQIGLNPDRHPRILTGAQLDALTDAQLRLALDDDLHFARLDPGQKVRIVAALQQKGAVVAVTGDGINDAPALKRADVGIAMGKGGTDAAREVADLILLDDHFATIVAAIAEGRTVMANVRKFLTYIFSSNVAEVIPFVAFVLLNIPLPLPVLLVLAVDLGTDLVPALALGAEKASNDVMNAPPPREGEHLLDRPVIRRTFGVLGTLEGLAGLTAFGLVLYQGGWTYGQELPSHDPLYLQATTASFLAIAVMQAVNLLHCRHESSSTLTYGLRGNPLLWAGLAFLVAVVLTITFVPPVQRLFSTLPPDPWLWAALLPMALVFWGTEELRKLRVRTLQKPT